MTKISFLGAGAIGARIITNLLTAGFDVTVWSRGGAPPAALAAARATIAATDVANSQPLAGAACASCEATVATGFGDRNINAVIRLRRCLKGEVSSGLPDQRRRGALRIIESVINQAK